MIRALLIGKEPAAAFGDDGRVRVIDGHQLIGEKTRQRALHRAQRHRTGKAGAENGGDTLILPRADVLADKGLGSMVEGVHRNIEKVFNVGSRAASRHNDTAVGIDGALDHHVGKAEHTGLDPRRDADVGNGAKALPVHA